MEARKALLSRESAELDMEINLARDDAAKVDDSLEGTMYESGVAMTDFAALNAIRAEDLEQCYVSLPGALYLNSYLLYLGRS